MYSQPTTPGQPPPPPTRTTRDRAQQRQYSDDVAPAGRRPLGRRRMPLLRLSAAAACLAVGGACCALAYLHRRATTTAAAAATRHNTPLQKCDDAASWSIPPYASVGAPPSSSSTWTGASSSSSSSSITTASTTATAIATAFPTVAVDGGPPSFQRQMFSSLELSVIKPLAAEVGIVLILQAAGLPLLSKLGLLLRKARWASSLASSGGGTPIAGGTGLAAARRFQRAWSTLYSGRHRWKLLRHMAKQPPPPQRPPVGAATRATATTTAKPFSLSAGRHPATTTASATATTATTSRPVLSWTARRFQSLASRAIKSLYRGFHSFYKKSGGSKLATRSKRMVKELLHMKEEDDHTRDRRHD